MSKLNDIFITKKDMYPFWLFRDIFGGKHTGGKFLCFINAHYPVGLASTSEDANKRAADSLKDGTWKVEMLKQWQPQDKIGWGFGDTPQDAFRKACYNSGYLTVKDVS